MNLTRNAITFAVINSLTTIVFLSTLNNLVTTGRFEDIAPWAIAYGLTWAVTGALLQGTDKARNYRGNIGFQYAAIQYVMAFLVIWVTKIFFPVIMPHSYLEIIFVTMLLIIISTLHYRHAKRNPKGIDKKEAFK